jgi:phytoene dehydrogenase-like protein
MTHTPRTCDAIVVGGGHNGLVSAAYPAKAGLRTVVLVRRTTTGGTATTEQPWPGLPGVSVIARDIVGPRETETEHGLIGGTIFHGALSVEQLSNLRPVPGYADHLTPVSGIYYASSAGHAGGGVSGDPEMQAAKAAQADARSGRRSPRRLLARSTR